MLRYRIIAAIAVAFLAVSPSFAQQSAGGLKKVVLDAGHGGRDPGATRTYNEKDIVLKVVLKLGALIEAKYPDVKVLYTRKTDVYVTLADRAKVANDAKADLFISVHADAVVSSQPSGATTCVMGLDKTSGNMEIAKRENSVIYYEDDYSTRYQGFDPNDEVSYIIFKFMQYSHLDKSLAFAEMLQNCYVKNLGSKNRGISQQPLQVLWQSAMPSVLTEIGFISNPDEERFMASDAGQDKIARSLLEAFSLYKEKMDKLSGVSVAPAATASAAQPAATETPSSGKGDSPQAVAGNPDLVYRVQIMALPNRIASDHRDFKNYRNRVECIRVEPYYKYYVGAAATFKEAQALLAEVKQSFPQAYIVPFHKGGPVSLETARSIESAQ